MTKLSQDEEQIVKLAFYDELEKLGWAELAVKAFSALAKLAPKAGKLGGYATEMASAFKAGGGAGLKAMAEYAPQFIKATDGSVKMTGIAASAGNSGWLQRGLGEGAHSLLELNKGMGPNLGLGGGFKQLGKNVFNLTKKQIGNERFRTVAADSNKLITKDGETFLKGKLFGDRKALGKAGDQFIFKKRLPAQALGVAGTPVGFAGTGLALGDKPKDAAGDFASWTFARPYAEAKMGYDMVKGIF